MNKEDNVLNKIKNIYSFISENAYYCREDFSLQTGAYNAALLLGISAGLLNGKIIYVGEYGLGKTTLAETISSFLFGLPKKIYSSASIKGNPEISMDQIIGRPHLGDLNKGKEKVIWSSFVLSRPKIVDEINRIPPNKQNILLSGLQTNLWSYLNSTIEIKNCPWFATKNYEDSGNTSIIPPLLDRFDLSVESKSPGLNNFRTIRYYAPIELSEKKHEECVYNLLNKEDFVLQDFIKEIDNIRREHKLFLEKETGLKLLSEEDINQIQEKVRSIKFSEKANLLLDAIIAEMGSCQIFGQKRVNQECISNCHFSGYSCFYIKNDLSTRTVLALDKYSKMIAFVDDEKTVQEHHVKAIAPYVLWHKTKLKESYLEEINHERREEVLELYAVKKLVKDIEKRQIKIEAKQKEIITALLKNDLNKAGDISSKMDNPLFKEYVRG